MKLLSLVALLPLLAPGAPADYRGDWTLDMAHSTGLPPYYANVKSHRLTIAQDDTLLDVFVTIDAGRAAPDTIRLDYPLGGAERRTTSGVRGPGGMMQVPTTLKAEPLAGGDLRVTIARDIPMGAAPVHAVTTEDWHLAPDGRSITIHRVDETPRGKMEATMVFVRER